MPETLGHVGGTTQKNMFLIPLLDPAEVGGRHCSLHPKIDCKPRIRFFSRFNVVCCNVLAVEIKYCHPFTVF